MRYMLLIWHDSSFTARMVKGDSAACWGKWNGEMCASMAIVCDRQPRTVSMHDGKLLVRVGPFAETTEEVAGYDIIECADFDKAIKIASKHAAAKFGTIEIRSVW